MALAMAWGASGSGFPVSDAALAAAVRTGLSWVEAAPRRAAMTCWSVRFAAAAPVPPRAMTCMTVLVMAAMMFFWAAARMAPTVAPAVMAWSTRWSPVLDATSSSFETNEGPGSRRNRARDDSNLYRAGRGPSQARYQTS